jgi:hypothetical protein
MASSSDDDSSGSSTQMMEIPKKARETPPRAAKKKAVAAAAATASNKKKSASSAKKRKSSSNRKMPKKSNKNTKLDTIKEETEIEYKVTKSRSANYLPHEDVWLTKAWVSASTNAAEGDEKTSQVFWKEVSEKYEKLAQQDPSVEVWEDRDPDSLMNRFQRSIQKGVQYWNKYYKKAKESKPSGWSEDDYIAKANELYEEVEGKPFKVAHCVPIMHQLPKWKPTYTDNGWSDEQLPPAVDGDNKTPAGKYNKLGKTAADDIDRPMGAKKFKQLRAEEASLTSAATTNASTAAALINSNEAVAKRIAASLDSLTDQAKKKNKHSMKENTINRMLEMGRLYKDVGELHKAKECLEKGIKLQEEHEAELEKEREEEKKKEEEQKKKEQEEEEKNKKPAAITTEETVPVPPSVVRTTVPATVNLLPDPASNEVDSPIDDEDNSPIYEA